MYSIAHADLQTPNFISYIFLYILECPSPTFIILKIGSKWVKVGELKPPGYKPNQPFIEIDLGNFGNKG